MAGKLTISTLNDSSGVLATQNGMTGIAKAWVNFVGSSAAINGSFNVSSITRNGTGDYTINYTTAMPNTNYAAMVTGQGQAGNGGSQWVGMIYQPTGGIYSTTQTRFLFGNSANGVPADAATACIAILGS